MKKIIVLCVILIMLMSGCTKKQKVEQLIQDNKELETITVSIVPTTQPTPTVQPSPTTQPTLTIQPSDTTTDEEKNDIDFALDEVYQFEATVVSVRPELIVKTNELNPPKTEELVLMGPSKVTRWK